MSSSDRAVGSDLKFSKLPKRVTGLWRSLKSLGIAMSGESRALIVPEAHYTLFEAERDGRPEIIVVNDALLTFAHNDIFPWHLRVRLEATELADNGMPTNPESKVLFEIGDAIEQAVLSGVTSNGGANALFLARSTWNELRELYFMVHDPEIAHPALQALLKAKDLSRSWEYKMEHDREWEKAGYIFQLFRLTRKLDA
jgi:hypothetical protein